LVLIGRRKVVKREIQNIEARENPESEISICSDYLEAVKRNMVRTEG